MTWPLRGRVTSPDNDFCKACPEDMRIFEIDSTENLLSLTKYIHMETDYSI